MTDDKYIAFDVHQATTVVSVVNAAGRDVGTAILPTQPQPLIRYLESLSGRLHLTLEEGTYSAWVYDLLEGRVAELVVCDPRRNALLKEGNRTDHTDARKLAESRKHTVAARLRAIPGFGPLRVALLIASMQTPHRFRTRRKLWTYAGLGLV